VYLRAYRCGHTRTRLCVFEFVTTYLQLLTFYFTASVFFFLLLDRKVYDVVGQLRNMEEEAIPYGIDLVKANLVDASKASNRKVCIIDSGYDLGHPDLQELNVKGYDGSKNTVGPWDEDENGHGTHVAGTIAALGGNRQGVVGVVPNGMLNLHIVRVFDDSGYWAWGSDLVSAMYECVEAKSNVINISFGGPFPIQTQEIATKDIFEEQGILLIAAAGNDGNSNYGYPASYPSVMSVAAIDSNSDWVDISQYNDQVDISAPGWMVESTYPRTKGAYESLSGTSSKLLKVLLLLMY
jgi:serine protease